jgi:hypothetical protein
MDKKYKILRIFPHKKLPEEKQNLTPGYLHPEWVYFLASGGDVVVGARRSDGRHALLLQVPPSLAAF